MPRLRVSDALIKYEWMKQKLTDDVEETESKIHAELDAHRVVERREFSLPN